MQCGSIAAASCLPISDVWIIKIQISSAGGYLLEPTRGAAYFGRGSSQT